MRYPRTRSFASASFVALVVVLATALLQPAQAAPAGKPRVKGVVAVGKTVSCDASRVPGRTVGYRWQRGGKVVQGRTQRTYRVTRADAGRKLACAVKVAGSHKVYASAAVPVVSAPQNTARPTVSREGNVLTCHPGTWVNDPDELLYSWTRDGSPYGGTQPTQAIGADDTGTFVCLVAGRNAAGQSGFVPSSGVTDGDGGPDESVTEAPRLTSPPVLSYAVPPNGPRTAVYPANGSADSTTGAHHGTWVGTPSYGPGRTQDHTDRAFSFDGADRVVMDTAIADFGTDGFAISFDIKTTSRFGSIASARSGCGNQGEGWFDVRNPGSLLFEVGGDHYAFLDSHADIADGAWHHVVVSRTSSGISVTVDGSTTSVASPAADVSPAAPFGLNNSPCIGQDTTTPLGGLIDNVRIGPLASEVATLSCSPGTWTPTPDRLFYTWTRNGSPVSGATKSTLDVLLNDGGTYVCLVAARNGAGQSGYQQSNGVAGPGATPPGGGGGATSAPTNHTPPSIIGTGWPGDPLTCNPGTWSHSPTSFTYQWARNGSEIGGATGPHFTPSTGDLGDTIVCRVAAWNSAGGSGQVGSAGVVVHLPTIVTGYDVATHPTPSNLPSYGFQATQFSEWGDAIRLDNGVTHLDEVTVTMSSWACETGLWYSACATTPGSTFDADLTINAYEIDAGSPTGIGALIGSVTQTEAIPFRPSTDPACGTGWSDGTRCFNGLATEVSFDLGDLEVPQEFILTIAYNTRSSGYQPTGVDGPIDSLNVGIAMDPATVGDNIDPDSVFLSYGRTGGVANPLTRDTGWVGYTPMFQVTGY